RPAASHTQSMHAPASVLDLRCKGVGRDWLNCCCESSLPGVAVHRGKIDVGAYDGRLIALDAVTGKLARGTDRGRGPRPVMRHHGARAPFLQRGMSAVATAVLNMGCYGRLTRCTVVLRSRVPGDPSKPFERIVGASRQTWNAPAGTGKWARKHSLG